MIHEFLTKERAYQYANSARSGGYTALVVAKKQKLDGRKFRYCVYVYRKEK